MVPKGDYHTVVNNVAWDDNDEEDCTLCVPPELSGTEMNSNTLVANNGASKFEGGGGTIENNYESQDVKRQMVDTDNSDYRPVPGGGFISQGLNSMQDWNPHKIFHEKVDKNILIGKALKKLH